MRPAAAVASTLLALACFAANSLLARAALGRDHADPVAFTAVRLASGALALLAVQAVRRRRPAGGSWTSALALAAYAAAFSLAYVRIGAGPGALILFAAVQATMLAAGVLRGARPTRPQGAGIALALAGVAWLTLPGAAAPDPLGAALMAVAGAAWGAYSLRGHGGGDPVSTTADNFLRAVPFAGALLAVAGAARPSAAGLALAIASGALASAGGYCLWYAVVPALGATRAAAVQLAVPVVAAVAAVALLGETPTLRLALSGAAIVAGIGIVMRRGRRA